MKGKISMVTQSWLSGHETWELIFVNATTRNKKVVQPKVGDTINNKLVLGIWVNKKRTIKAYKVQCLLCFNVHEYYNANNLKGRIYDRCSLCYNTNASARYFNENFSSKNARTLNMLYAKRYDSRTKNHEFDENWKHDYIDFANYISSLPGFELWPIYQLDRIDNTKGYIKGNVRFIPNHINCMNYTDAPTVIFNGETFYRPEFIQNIVGRTDYRYVYNAIFSKIDNYGYTLKQALDEFYTQYSDREVKSAFDDWYRRNFGV